MQAITIHPESEEQFETIKAFLKALKVPFEPNPIDLPNHVLRSIDKSLQQIEEGDTVSLEAFKEKHFRKH